MLTGLLVGLAGQYLPKLIGKITGSDEAEQVAGKVAEIGSELLGRPIKSEDDVNELTGVLQTDPTAVLKFREGILDKVESILNMEMVDTQNARDAAREDERTGRLMYSMAWIIVLGSFFGIGALIGAATYIMMNLEQFSQGESTVIMSLISAALTQLYNERNQVLGYIFGNKVANKVAEVKNALTNNKK